MPELEGHIKRCIDQTAAMLHDLRVRIVVCTTAVCDAVAELSTPWCGTA